MSRIHDPVLCPLPDDQRRLHWLREDLASCLVQIGTILRRTSGEFGLAPASQVTIAAESDPPPDPADPAPMHVPATIAWTWADGTQLTYHWSTHTCATSLPDAGANSEEASCPTE